MDFRGYLKYLACPYCKDGLDYTESDKERFYSCRACGKDYPIVNGIPRFLEISDELLKTSKEHWEGSPHFQYEARSELYTREYYLEQDKWRQEEVDPFSMGEYKFDKIKGRVILDIGCGSGWVIKQAAKNGAFAIGVDFSEKSVISAKSAMEIYGLEGLVIQADAQYLPLKSNVIDRVYSIGVLHHIPRTEQGIEEAHRVLKKGGSAFISLYGRLFFFNPALFPVALFLLKLLLKAPKVRDGIQNTGNYDEFYRYMDGPTNPIGRWYDDAKLSGLFRKFQVMGCTKSHFPLRYLKLGRLSFNKITPKFIRRFFDKNLGMMRNFQLRKEG